MKDNKDGSVRSSIDDADRVRARKTKDATMGADDVRLAELGYKSEFQREFSVLETIAFSFSIMAVIPGVSSTLGLALASGGHVGMVWGWFIPCFFVMCIAASMAEMASSMPQRGVVLFLGQTRAREVFGTGKLDNRLGEHHGPGDAGLFHRLYSMITTAVAVGTDGTVNLGTGPTYGILLAILFIHGVICSAGTKILARLNLFYAFVTLGTTVGAIIALFVCSGENRVSAKDAFTLYENHTGWSNSGWAFLLCFTVPMWQFTGYDSAAHISEEIRGAAKAAPLAILVSVASVAILGWILSISASFATASVADLLATDLALPMGQLYLDVVGKRGMLAIWSLTTTVQASGYAFLCGAAQGVDASRVVFAFARDNELPGSRWWKKVNSYTQTPVNAVWLVMVLAAVCGLLGFSSTALTSLVSASVIGMYASYTTPIFLRVTSGRDKLVPGPFSLGKWYLPIGCAAVAWVTFIIVLLSFPTVQIATAETMNYAVVIIMAVFIFASCSWIISARRWFVGPLPNIDDGSTVASLDEK
ncbi:uncharacterized protein FIBRA_01219 [Fibroporia radiculosa]|uniref:Amino acid permease/ SLC12A domain-containing protein n=1 Tax=Fibroporia radiculosa TaxID=599839 RepID=J4H0Z4_9APHY|nr:uncharacterized protein FIBRA_01219 [Fibroporia radiculosa]CCL99204.1 predicted protein [Fibroporia radiculosa]